jgi:hypothetical protein
MSMNFPGGKAGRCGQMLVHGEVSGAIEWRI